MPPQVTCLIGCPQSGKTSRLVGCARELLAQGCDPASILVVASTPTAAQSLTARMAASGVDLKATTMCQVALDVLGCASPDGDGMRVMAGFEVNCLLEDLKTCGIRPKRIREMLRFIERGLTELADDDPTWLYTDEELQVIGLLKDIEAFQGAIMPAQVSNAAVNVLRAGDDALLSRVTRAHVLVDDYQLLSRASQVLAGMLATETLTVTGDAFETSPVGEEYPYAQGLTELASTEGAELIHLVESYAPVQVIGALDVMRTVADQVGARADAADAAEGMASEARLIGVTVDELKHRMGAEADERAASDTRGTVVARGCATGIVELAVTDDPASEAACVARAVADAIASGADAARVAVAVPNVTWQRSMERVLVASGVPVAHVPADRKLRGDIRDLGRGANLRAYALLHLAADATDDVSWRLWCGGGDWLTQSPGFGALRAWGRERGQRLHQVLAGLVGDADASALLVGGLDTVEAASVEQVLAAYVRTQGCLAGLGGLAGRDLIGKVMELAGVDAGCLEGFCASARALMGADAFDGAHASDLVAAIGPIVAGQGAFDRADAVRVGTPAQLGGSTYDLLVVSGQVNGFVPPHVYFDMVQTSFAKVRRTYVGQVRALYALMGSAAGRVLITAFRGIEAAQAEQLGLKVERIRMSGGRRMAVTSPSEVLGAIGYTPEVLHRDYGCMLTQTMLSKVDEGVNL